ncbi:MAG: DUF1549 and DUF1553 domain-containing protein [Planctomycetota bacterium]|nr:DUF1549 and DUF1553 domain-containing protein [Planctomycetota bacterium]
MKQVRPEAPHSRAWRVLAGPVLGALFLALALLAFSTEPDGGLEVKAGDEPKYQIPDVAGLPSFTIKNPVDRFVLARMQEEKLEPSGLCTDEEFIRRAYLDIAGVIPGRTAVRAFLQDKSPAKRERLVDQLLADERYADHWTIVWGDLLREHSRRDNQEGSIAGSFRDWIRQALRDNMPYDQFVTELITASGRPDQNGAVNFFLRDENNRVETINMVSVAFMGTRMQCAQCHDHPFDRWEQEDFHGLMAFLSPRTVTFVDENATLAGMKDARGIPAEYRAIIDPLIDQAIVNLKEEKESEGEEGGGMMMRGGDAQPKPRRKGAPQSLLRQMNKDVEEKLGREKADRLRQILQRFTIRKVVERPNGDYRMPTEGDGVDSRKQGGELVKPSFAWEPEAGVPANMSRRAALAKFVTSSRQFAQVQANRIWGQLMGRGLVHPTDDFRPKNPPSHPELLEWLTDELVRAKFDNKHVIRLIVNSSAYQRSTKPTEKNKDDTTYYSHAKLRRMTAEQIYDSLLVATGEKEALRRLGMPREELTAPGLGGRPGQAGRRERRDNEPVWAVEVETPARAGSFLEVFNQPDREQMTVQRDEDGSITQALEMLNGASVNNRVLASAGHLAKELLDQKLPAAKCVEELFLAALSRMPTKDEMAGLSKIVKGNPPPPQLLEDLMWALLNSREFVFVK